MSSASGSENTICQVWVYVVAFVRHVPSVDTAEQGALFQNLLDANVPSNILEAANIQHSAGDIRFEAFIVYAITEEEAYMEGHETYSAKYKTETLQTDEEFANDYVVPTGIPAPIHKKFNINRPGDRMIDIKKEISSDAACH